MPAKIGAFETANAKAVLTAYVDDYAEVWINGEMPRGVGITSSATIQGFNIPNRVIIADAVKARDKVEIAIFGIMGRSRSCPRTSCSSARHRSNSTSKHIEGGLVASTDDGRRLN
jgi:hypothetical protein